MEKDEFERLLTLNCVVADSLVKKRLKDSEFLYAEILAAKVFQHAVTAYLLWTTGTKISVPGMTYQVNFLDSSSIEVLARACLEAQLTFHYVFVEPISDQDEWEFRYCAWMLAGFAKREHFPALGEEARAQYARDTKMNERHRSRIRRTSHFQRLTARQKGAVLMGRKWPPEGTLTSMAERVFGPVWGKALYGLMSSHAHSDGLSAVQIRQAAERPTDRALADGSISQIGMVLAHMTADYAARFVRARRALACHPDRQLNDMYVQIARRLAKE